MLKKHFLLKTVVLLNIICDSNVINMFTLTFGQLKAPFLNNFFQEKKNLNYTKLLNGSCRLKPSYF